MRGFCFIEKKCYDNMKKYIDVCQEKIVGEYLVFTEENLSDCKKLMSNQSIMDYYLVEIDTPLIRGGMIKNISISSLIAIYRIKYSLYNKDFYTFEFIRSFNDNKPALTDTVFDTFINKVFKDKWNDIKSMCKFIKDSDKDTIRLFKSGRIMDIAMRNGFTNSSAYSDIIQFVMNIR